MKKLIALIIAIIAIAAIVSRGVRKWKKDITARTTG